MEALSFPFRFKRGHAVTLDSTSEPYAAQRVASVISTRVGELPLLPAFGIDDPEFDEFDSAGLYSTCASHFPEILITDIFESVTPDGRVLIDVSFDILTEGTTNGIS